LEERPKKFIVRLLESAAMFALAMFLIRLGICYLYEIWWVLVIIAVLTVGSIVGYRVWKRRADGGW
jgi:fatty acid desaturase